MSARDAFHRYCLLAAFLGKHNPAPVSEVARFLGISASDLLKVIDELNGCLAPSPINLLDDQQEWEQAWVPLTTDRIDFIVEAGEVQILVRTALSHRPIKLTRPEATALVMALQAFADSGEGEYIRAADRMLVKVRRLLSPGVSAAADQAADRLALDAGQADETAQLAVLDEALRRRLAVDIAYYTAGRDELTRRRIHPYVIHNHSGRYYVIAHDEQSGEIRHFRLDRLRRADCTDRGFARPADLDIDRLRADRPYYGRQAERAARLRIHPPADRLAREEWSPERLEPQPDGSVIARLEFTGLAGLANWVLEQGEAVEVLEPEDLRAEVIRRARAMLEG